MVKRKPRRGPKAIALLKLSPAGGHLAEFKRSIVDPNAALLALVQNLSDSSEGALLCRLRFKSLQKHRNCALQGNSIAQSQRASECSRTIPFINFLVRPMPWHAVEELSICGPARQVTVQCGLTAGHRHFFSSRAIRRHRCSTATESSKPYVGSLVANELKFAIVIARFNDLVTKLLLEGALEAFDRHGGDRDSVDVSARLHKAICQALA